MAIEKMGGDKFYPGEPLLNHYYKRGEVEMSIVTTEMGIFVKAVHYKGEGQIIEYLDCLDPTTGVFKLRQRKCDYRVGIIYVAWRDRQFPVGSRIRMRVANEKANILATVSELGPVSVHDTRRLPE